MGVVYRAYDPRLKRSVALKLVAPEFAVDPRFRERFLAESELAASLEHPNVVPIHDAGETEGQLALAMRYVEGTDLKTLLAREGALEPKRAMAFCAQLAGALDAAHARGLVHRDVKPSNVLLDKQEHVYLADFGLTRRLVEPGFQVGIGSSLGTPAYAAPERIEGGEVDGRADVYSLGCLLYEALSGEPPFPHDSELATLWAHLSDPPPEVTAYPALDPVITKALAKDAKERYASCAELVEAAAEALGIRDVVVVRDRRPLLLTAAGAAIVITAVLAGVLLTRGGGPSRPSTKPTPVPQVDSLQRIDPKTNKLVATVRTGADPTGVAAGDGGVWVIHLDDNRISKIDPRTDDIVATGSAPSPTAIAVGAGSVWVAHGDATLSQLDARTAAAVHSVPVPDLTEFVATGPGAVWAVSNVGGFAARINPQSASVSTSVKLPPLFVRGIAADEGGLWVSSSDVLDERYGVARIDPLRRKVVAHVPVLLGARGIAVGDGAVWVANSLGNTVSEIEPSTNRVVRRIRVGKDPVGVALGEGAIWVTNYKDGTVSRIDPRLGRVVATIRVGPNPDHLAAGEGGIWVTVHVR